MLFYLTAKTSKNKKRVVDIFNTILPFINIRYLFVVKHSYSKSTQIVLSTYSKNPNTCKQIITD